MHSFRNILYASTGIGEDTEGLKQALSLARANQAVLKSLLVYPELPRSHEMYQDKYREFMLDQMEAAIRQARASLRLGDNEPPVTVELDAGSDPPAVRMIRYALRETHGLLIKETEPIEGGVGFTSLDMTLLRNCPCPVWLARPISRPRTEIRVAVAVSTDNREQSEQDLALRLLTLGRSLADTCDSELTIVSCWDFEFERFLRSNTRVEIPVDTMQNTIQNAQAAHQAELGRLIEESGIDGRYHVHRMKGLPEKMIPLFVRSRKIDILVMGTVARTGIFGYLMGNTAENIMHELPCALLAIKPGGFISPVKAY
ncbi:MAG: universal stress protein [Desulfobulbus sp.]|jgi:nucleotide-binding universal stress UspA family protein|nr:universal stress protein [Desulfobulbus sp.]